MMSMKNFLSAILFLCRLKDSEIFINYIFVKIALMIRISIKETHNAIYFKTLTIAFAKTRYNLRSFQR